MQFIILIKPKSIQRATSIDKGDYYVVYNFEYNKETKTILNEEEIDSQQALEYARNGTYEIRYYKDNEEKNILIKKGKDFKNNDGTALIVLGSFFFSSIFLTLISK